MVVTVGAPPVATNRRSATRAHDTHVDDTLDEHEQSYEEQERRPLDLLEDRLQVDRASCIRAVAPSKAIAPGSKPRALRAGNRRPWHR